MLMKNTHLSNANSGDPDLTPQSAASDPRLHCLPPSLINSTLNIKRVIITVFGQRQISA